MTKEELKEKAEEWIKDKSGFVYKLVDYGYGDMQDAFLAGYETGKDEAEADLATVAYMQGAERYKKELAKRAEQIEALNKDKDYFSDALDKQIEATYKVVEENNELKEKWLQATDEGTSWAHLKSLEKENKELKEQNRNYEQLLDTGSVTLMKERLKNYKQLIKAKEHIRTLISCLIDWVQEGDKDYHYIVDAEQFLKE